MIYKFHDGRVVAVFGNGNICVSSLSHRLADNIYGISLKWDTEDHEVGEPIDRTGDFDISKEDIILKFKNVESLNVLIDHLNSVRCEMVCDIMNGSDV